MNNKRQLIGKNELCRTILDSTPLPMFVVDEDVQILDYNAAAGQMLGTKPSLILRQKSGGILRCVNAKGCSAACGQAPACKNCVIRNSVRASLAKKKIVRERMELQSLVDGKARSTHFLVSTTPFRYDGRKFALLVLEDVSELLALRKIMPVCSKCRRVRDDQDFWHHIDHYLAANSHIDLTHAGLCPDCIVQNKSLTPILSGHRRVSAAD